MKYIILFCLINRVSITCPDYKNTMISCAVYHYKTELLCHNTRIFDNRNDALNMYIEMANDYFNYTNVKLDSVNFSK